MQGKESYGNREERIMAEKRDAYVKKLKDQIDDWNAQIDKLSAKVDQADTKVKAEYRRRLEDARKKRKDLEDKIASMQKAGEGAWEALKEGIENSWKQLKAGLSKTKSDFEGREKTKAAKSDKGESSEEDRDSRPAL
jgi:predicted  nucleic acid-binding Zn-ribbon protein